MSLLVAGLLLVGESARAQSPAFHVEVVNGVGQIVPEPGMRTVADHSPNTGVPEVRIFVRSGRPPPRVGPGCDLVAVGKGTVIDSYLIECPGARGWNLDGSRGRDNVRIDSELSVTAQLGGGNDTFTATAAKGIVLNAGAGSDVIVVGQGGGSRGPARAQRAVLFGGDGNDRITQKGTAAARIDGGRGNDRLTGGTAGDICVGGAGNDRIFGGRGNDTLRGGAGNDVLTGGRGRDSVGGGSGRDTVDGRRERARQR